MSCGKLLGKTIASIWEGKLRPVAQSADGVTYAGRIKKADGQIDWASSAAEIDRSIHAYNPWPVAQTSVAGEQFRCWSSRMAAADEIESASSGQLPGAVLAATAAGIAVQTGAGVLVLTEVQVPGRKRMAAADYARSHSLDGVILGQ